MGGGSCKAGSWQLGGGVDGDGMNSMAWGKTELVLVGARGYVVMKKC